MSKDQILSELRRTAATNGGKPLGFRRFERETGIRKWDWSKFWARWGDAVLEAGLSPNELTSSYDDATLLESVAALMRQLGRLPTPADLRLKATQDSTFPSEKAIRRRFRRKSDWVTALVAHCRQHCAWEDLLELCESYSPRENPKSHHEHEVDNGDFGSVYLVKSGRYYKIGRSNSPGRRAYEVALQLPERVQLVHSIQTDDPAGIESYWHGRFKAKRANGEWFNLDSSDVRAFKRRKSFM